MDVKEQRPRETMAHLQGIASHMESLGSGCVLGNTFSGSPEGW